MKEIISEVLHKLSISSYAEINTKSGRDFIADKLLETFKKKHIVFYTNLEKHNEEKLERGL